MMFKIIKNKFNYLLFMAIAAIPLISCGKKVSNVYDSHFNLSHNFDFLQNNDYENWNTFLETLVTSNKEVAAYKIDGNTFEFKELLAREYKGEKHFSELILNNQNQSEAVSYISLFPKNSNSNILTPRNGIVNWDKLYEMSQIENYSFVSNIQSVYLTSPSFINTDLLVKDGVIYNIPTTTINQSKMIRKSTTKLAGVIMDKDDNLEFIQNIPDDDDSLVKLEVSSGQSKFDAIERKNVIDFDVRKNIGIDESVKISNNAAYKVTYTGIFQGIKDGDVRVISEYFNEQREPLDLSDNSLFAYLVKGVVTNGITTVNNRFFGDEIDIIQAPYKGKIVQKIPNQSNYVVPRGSSLIVSKGRDIFNLNDEVSVDYVFNELNPLSMKLKNSKWATSSHDYIGNKMQISSTYIYPGDEVDNQGVSNAAWVLRNGTMPYRTDSTLSNFDLTVNYIYFIETENGDFGIATITKSKYNPDKHRISGNQIALYLKSLGVKNALALDGGGSAQQYIKQDGQEWVKFHDSANSIGYRPLSTALAIRRKDE